MTTRILSEKGTGEKNCQLPSSALHAFEIFLTSFYMSFWYRLTPTRKKILKDQKKRPKIFIVNNIIPHDLNDS